jgi:electron transfer flavoprotein beta subunit
MHRILVGLKRVVDYNVRVRVRTDGSGVDTGGAKMSINPFDAIALEEAVRIKDNHENVEIVAVTIGAEPAQQQLRTALAMGADRAVLVAHDTPSEPLTIARCLYAIVQREQPDLVLLGKQSIDGDNAQVGPMLAALWQRPQASFASRIDVSGRQATVEREIDAGLETIEIDLPAVITADLRLNEPRFVKLPEILKAKRKPLESTTLAGLGVTAHEQFKTVQTKSPPPRPSGMRVSNVDELIAALRERGVWP